MGQAHPEGEFAPDSLSPSLLSENISVFSLRLPWELG